MFLKLRTIKLRKMKKNFKKIFKTVLLFSFMLFWACEKEYSHDHEHNHSEIEPHLVSLDFFKSTTNIKDIDVYLKDKMNVQSKFYRVADTSLTNFTIDVSKIKRYIIGENKFNFTFRLYPINNENGENEIYNLVLSKKDNNWNTSIFLLKLNENPTIGNMFSSIEQIYTSSDISHLINARRICSTTEIVSFHCTKTGPCDGSYCDYCTLCATTSIGYACMNIDEPFYPIIGESSNGGGGVPSPCTTQICNFKNDLNTLQTSWWYYEATDDNKNQIENYLNTNNYNNASIAFVKELIDLANAESSTDNDAIGFILQAKMQNKMQSELDDVFLQSVNQYTSIDTATMNPVLMAQIRMYFTMKCAILRYNHPNWSDLAIYWEASKDLVHITLDGFGMIPVVGEVADLTNGVLYLIEGDGINATLSFAATIPLAGWTATGAKYAFKIKAVSTISTKVKLTWKVVGDIIDFGNRGQLRKVLGLAVGNLDQAHHIMPWAWRNHDIIQKAASSGSAFHMNEALNGIAVAAWRNQPNHNIYNNLLKSKLDALPSNLTPEQAYNQLTNIVNQAKQAIINNPNTHLNDLIF